MAAGRFIYGLVCQTNKTDRVYPLVKFERYAAARAIRRLDEMRLRPTITTKLAMLGNDLVTGSALRRIDSIHKLADGIGEPTA